MKIISIPVALIALSLNTALNAQVVNLVQNGGFETGDLSGWTLSGGDGDGAHSQVYSLPTDPSLLVHSGNSSLDLSPGAPSLASISQGLATTAGQTYTVSLWVIDTAGGIGEIAVTFGSTKIYDGANPDFATWTKLSFTETALGSETVLTIAADKISGANLIDDISVVAAVPEPAAYGTVFALVGLGVGLLTRRAKRP